MTLFYYIYLFIFGTLFGSFSSVIISRLKENKSGIIGGRSECPKCKHKLSIIDLFPIFSYLSTLGKCRYCKTKIPLMYPLLEISLGIFFIIISYFLIDINLIFLGDKIEIIRLCFYLILGFLSFVFVVYDLKFLEIPDSILAILIITTITLVGLQSFIPNFEIIKTLPNFNPEISLNNTIIIFLGSIVSIGFLYLIMLKGMSEIYDIIILLIIVAIICTIKYIFNINLEQTAIGSALIGVIGIFIFFFLQILISGGSWLGGGDLRIGILMGLIAGITFSFSSLMISYMSGSIIGIVFIIIAKIKQNLEIKKSFTYKIRKVLGLKINKSPINTQMPFGPFLAIGLFGILFFQELILELINTYL